jgi:hypothetical protein
MLGYLTGFELDTPEFFEKIWCSAIIPESIKKENWSKNNYLVYLFF